MEKGLWDGAYMRILLNGKWHVVLEDGTTGQMDLPGTLDENGIGHRDVGANQWHPDAVLGNAAGEIDKDAPIATRFTRRHTYEGEARISRKITVPDYGTDRLFVLAERARALRLLVDGEACSVFRQGTLSTPYIFELTGAAPGEHEFTFLSDNSYPGMPKAAIYYSSAATDETQTNWNGILGECSMYTRPQNFIDSLRVYPRAVKKEEKNKAGGYVLDVCVELAPGAKKVYKDAKIILQSEALAAGELEDTQTLTEIISYSGEGLAEAGTDKEENPKTMEIWFRDLPLRENVKLWDEDEGNLYEMAVTLDNGMSAEDKGGSTAECRTRFGIRSFGDNGSGRLALNGRAIFLRGEANCAEYPETGHPPMTIPEWKEMLLKYRSYGINFVRFHSHCEPEAAFAAADELGMLLQPELSHWDPKDAFGTEESYRYYRAELVDLLKTYANHPSFVMLTLGNELQAQDEGRERMRELVRTAKRMDPTRLYANGSNAFYGEEGCDPESDFYTSQSCKDVVICGTFSGMRGYLNENYPSADRTYDEAMAEIRKEYQKPVFSFEVGQFEVLPDFEELESFHGISDPVNLKLIKKRVEERGLLPTWEKYVEATGELSRLAYREEIEAAMRTRELSGISLLGLQDFPGQGTALVGMMNSHLEPKPYDFARPERFREFFQECRILVKLPHYTYEAGERLIAEVEAANFGKRNIEGVFCWTLAGKKSVSENGNCEPAEIKSKNTVIATGEDTEITICRPGSYTEVGSLDIPLDFVEKNTALTLKVRIGDSISAYPIWVYRKTTPVCPENVYETRAFDVKTREILQNGGRVYLSPDADKESLPNSIKTQFTTDFWSVGTFADQEGGMGQLIDTEHPIFKEFPTDFHTDWQWWIMATKRAVILPHPMKTIITEMDSYAFLRPMAQMIEFRCLKGKVLLSTMELHKSQQYPEVRALQASIYTYLSGENFEPAEEITEEELSMLVRG
ncbi:MAG: glycoside hydrolase family 2 TIM barrel-domain containing protein [Waltera sp.]|jgi:glycoside hydrolase family 2 gh2F|uniref:glycoside hydrolase family 2 TIM barrel-domain containing protein n=1 Tax=Waltera sp. TaxID=2815806 RepID=UPI003078567B